MTKTFEEKKCNYKYTEHKPTTLTFTKKDHEDIQKVKTFFGIKTNVGAIRKALEEMIRRNEL